MDRALLNLTGCRRLSLSGNCIEHMIPLQGLANLQVLVLSRNDIRRIQHLDCVANTLEELWISYNMIEQLDGLSQCRKLRTLYISHNKIKKWEEVEKLSDNPRLEKVTLANNPVYKVAEVIKFKNFENPKISVLSRIPWLKSLDN